MPHARAAFPASHPSQLINADGVILDDVNLKWTSSAGEGAVNADEILFVLDKSIATNQEPAFIVCCLREGQDGSDGRFQLLLVATDQCPDSILHQHRLSAWPSHLSQRDGNSVDIIVSTKSGIGLAEQFWETALVPLWGLAQNAFGSSPSPPPTVITTESKQSVRQFARRLWGTEPRPVDGSPKSRTIVLLSGDGGVVDLLNGGDELAPDVPSSLIAILPLGTGNALFHSLHKPVAPSASPSPLVLGLRTLFRGVSADLPVFRASFPAGSRIVSFTNKDDEPASQDSGDVQASRHETAVSHLYSAIVVSYGFHASIVYESDTPEYRRHGDKRFGMVAEELLRKSHPYTADVDVRRTGASSFERDPRAEHGYVLVTPLSNLERTFTISPASKPLDGKLRLVQFGAIGGARTLEVMHKAYDGGKHVGLKWAEDGEEVRYEEVEEIKIRTREEDARWRNICVDGTTVQIPREGEVSVKKVENGPFRVLVDSRVV